MNEFKIIFYIGIAIAWAVYKNYQKVQANRPKTNLPPNLTPEMATAKSMQVNEPVKKTLLQERIEFKKNQTEKEKQIFKKPLIEKPSYVPLIKKEIKTNADSISIVEFPAQKNNNEIQTVKNISDKETPTENLFDIKNIDLRLAIIYSEILKRPYV